MFDWRHIDIISIYSIVWCSYVCCFAWVHVHYIIPHVVLCALCNSSYCICLLLSQGTCHMYSWKCYPWFKTIMTNCYTQSNRRKLKLVIFWMEKYKQYLLTGCPVALDQGKHIPGDMNQSYKYRLHTALSLKFIKIMLEVLLYIVSSPTAPFQSLIIDLN